MPVAIIQERIIPLLAPVRIYTAKELAAMPLSQMNAAIEAQEKYVFLEQNTRMGVAAIEIRRLLEHGSQLVQVCEKSRTRYRIGDIYYPPPDCQTARGPRAGQAGCKAGGPSQ